MEVKGTAVAAISEFVKSKFPADYEKWLSALSEPSRNLMQNKALAGSWYPVDIGIVEPTKKICEMFFGGNPKGANEMGRISADVALKGIYKLFVKAGTPQFIISRASTILASYYRPCELVVHSSTEKSCTLHFSKFTNKEGIIEERISGWIERALEINGCSNPVLKIGKSMAKGDPITEMFVTWK